MHSANSEERSWPRWERNADAILTVMLFAGISVVLAQPLFSHTSWLIFVQDDLLYYLKVAQNIVHGQGSTFNGLVPTNGYQPLWLLVLIVLSWFTERPRLILGFLAFTDLAAAVATFVLARRLLRTSEVRPLLIFAFAACVTLYSLSLFFYGMEVTLTVPILLGVFCILRNVSALEHSVVRAFLLGLLLSAMVLSRIDTLLLGGLIVGGMLIYAPARRLVRAQIVAAVAVGMLPVLAYFFFNHATFHTWLPISGMAKELKLNRTPSLEPWRMFFHPLAAGFTLVLLAGFVLLPKVAARLNPMERVFFPAVIAFPFVYYSVLSCVSDWTLWGWYMYPIRTALCIALAIFCLFPPLARLLQRPAALALLSIAVFGYLASLRWTRQQTDIYAASVEIAEFAKTHPGIYAMGDRAGRVAYLIPDPVIQTEGLMMDLPYLQNVKAQTPLRTVLARYHAHYYVATAYVPFTGCFQAAEPAKAGPHSAHMRDVFCDAPVATYFHDGIETLIFDLDPGPANTDAN